MYLLEINSKNHIYLCFRNILSKEPTILDDENDYIKFIPINYNVEVSKLISSTVYKKEISFKDLLNFIKRKELEKENFERVEIIKLEKDKDGFWVIDIFKI